VVIYVICIFCSSGGTLTTITYDSLIRTNCGDEHDLPPFIRMPYTFGKAFLLVRTDWTACCHDIIHLYYIKK
jgi:hypothetical protein